MSTSKKRTSKTKAQRNAQRAAVKTAQFVLEEKLDIAGIDASNYEHIKVVDIDDNRGITFSLEITITDLDIEVARNEGK